MKKDKRQFEMPPMKRFFSIILFCSVITGGATAQQNVNITIKLSGLKDDRCLFANYFGTKQYVQDTLPVSKETITIKKTTPLDPGMYCLVTMDGKLLLDFFVDKNEQQFSMSSSLQNIAGNMQVKKSENNDLFYQWIRFVTQNKHIADSLGKIVASLREQGKNQEAETFIKKLDDLNAQATLKQQRFDQRPELLVSRFMKAQQEVEIPLYDENGVEMSQQERFYYAQNHYFDNMRLDDEGLLRTPVYGRKLDFYFNNLMTPLPDSVIKYSEMWIEQAKGSFKTYQYVVWQASNYAESAKEMGVENAFVHIIDNHYAKNDSLSIPDMRSRLMKRADELRNSLVGVKAPNMMMQDSAFILRELYKINADFVIVYFFDPDCGHCKTDTDTLLMLYHQEKEHLNFDIFAVCNDTSMQKMKQYIQSKNIPWTVVNGPRTATKPYGTLYDVPSTPTLYMMDKNKIIIAKRLSPKQMIDMMRRKSGDSITPNKTHP
jgi:peroxiredoxin